MAERDSEGNIIRDANGNASYGQYVSIQNAKLSLDMTIDVSLYGSGRKEDGNEIDLSKILDLILGLINPNSAISGSTLRLVIKNAIGNDSGAFLKLNLTANVDLENWTVELAVRLRRNTVKDGESTLLGLYLVDDALYVDLQGILGETAKICVNGLNLSGKTGLIYGLLGKYIDGEAGTSSDASTSDASDIEKIEQTMRDYAYFMIMVNPQKFLLQLNADLINVI